MFFSSSNLYCIVLFEILQMCRDPYIEINLFRTSKAIHNVRRALWIKRQTERKTAETSQRT